jgi:hypothetical protein
VRLRQIVENARDVTVAVPKAAIGLYLTPPAVTGGRLSAEPRSILKSMETAMKGTTVALVACLVGTMVSNVAAATTNARIDRILIYETGNLVYVYPVGGVLNPPGCHGSNGNYYSFSLNRPRAKEYLAGLLSAQAQGAVVEFTGTGACTDQSVSETLAYFMIYSH